MIGRLTGVLAEKAPPQLLVDVGGVGYELDVPMSTFYNLPAVGERVTLLTHFVVREDADKKLKIEAPKLSKDQDAPMSIGGAAQSRIVNSVGRPMAGGAPALQPGDDLNVKVSLPVESLLWGFMGFVVLLLIAIAATIFARRAPRVASRRAHWRRPPTDRSHSAGADARRRRDSVQDAPTPQPTPSPPNQGATQRVPSARLDARKPRVALASG